MENSMTQIKIESFREVILYELQRSGKTLFEFSEIWRACEKSKVHSYNTQKFAKPFARDMMGAIRQLSEDGLIAIHTKDGGDRIHRITLTKAGSGFLAGTIFTHQQMMGDVA